MTAKPVEREFEDLRRVLGTRLDAGAIGAVISVRIAKQTNVLLFFNKAGDTNMLDLPYLQVGGDKIWSLRSHTMRYQYLDACLVADDR
jgi:hypothetical protein